jgi:hypothetical protein
MAKADTETTTEKWTLLSDVLTSLTKRWRSPDLAKRLLVEELAKGEVRWRYLRWEGPGRPSDPNGGEPGFWRGESDINWEESWAKCGDSTAFRIEIPKRDLVPLLRIRESILAPILTVAAAVTLSTPSEEKPVGPQMRRVKTAIEKHFPKGTDGISTPDVHQGVLDELENERKRTGKKDPSPDTTARALGRKR